MQIKLTFDQELNISLSIGDIVWYTPVTITGGHDVSDKSSIIKLGEVESVDRNNKIVLVKKPHDPLNYAGISLTQNDFVMFSKPNSFNTSSIKGYYAKVRLDNNSTEKIELFAVSSEISESSK
tara:strand:- start:665 stop:1033 length:369 start_codon:yes stop_codon:yes gene_type:complete